MLLLLCVLSLAHASHFDLGCDFIVVGAGTSGCIITSQLANAFPQKTICSFVNGPNCQGQPETTPQYDAFGTVPNAFFTHSRYGIMRNTNIPLSNPKAQTYEHWNQCKGGASAFNTRFTGRIPAGFADRVAAAYPGLGANGFNSANYNALWNRMEHWTPGVGDPPGGPLHGTSGPVNNTVFNPVTEPTVFKFSQAFAQAAGYQILPGPSSTVDDGINVGNVESVGTLARSFSVAPDGSHYMNDTCEMFGVGQPNVVLKTMTTVTKLLFCRKGTRDVLSGGDNIETCGIQFFSATVPGELPSVQTAYASNEVIITAGAIPSVKLLQVSGYGPCNHFASLGSLGPACIYNDPNIGQNLADSLLTSFLFLVPSAAAEPHDNGNLNALFARSSVALANGAQPGETDFGIVWAAVAPAVYGAGCIQYGGPQSETSHALISNTDIMAEMDVVIGTDQSPLYDCVALLRKAEGIFAQTTFVEELPPLSNYPNTTAGNQAAVDQNFNHDWHNTGGITPPSIDGRFRLVGVPKARVCGLATLPIPPPTHSTFTLAMQMALHCSDLIIQDNS